MSNTPASRTLSMALTMITVLAACTLPAMNASAAERQSRPAALLQSGVPVLFYANCSASVVRSPRMWGEDLVMFSARHCFDGDRSGSGLDAHGTAYSSGSILGFTDPSQKAFAFDLRHSAVLEARDMVAARVEGPVRNIDVLQLAVTLPAPGEMITIWGYPAKGIPLFGGVSHLASLSCEYLGPALVQAPNRKNGERTIQHVARCERHVFIKGMSGGPVLDGNGHMIGVQSQMIDDTVDFKDGKSYLFFAPVSEEDFTALPPQGRFSGIPGYPSPQTLLNANYFFTRQIQYVLNDDTADAFVRRYDGFWRKANLRLRFKDDLVDGLFETLDDQGDVTRRDLFEMGIFKSRLP